jgi:hypothetical protein
MSDTRSVGPGLRHLDVEVALAEVARRLTARFSPQVPASVVSSTVRAVAERWQDAPVREFVPLLVERRSIEQLRKVLAEPAPGQSPFPAQHPEGFSQVA